jgi:hypothetical protein
MQQSLKGSLMNLDVNVCKNQHWVCNNCGEEFQHVGRTIFIKSKMLLFPYTLINSTRIFKILTFFYQVKNPFKVIYYHFNVMERLHGFHTFRSYVNLDLLLSLFPHYFCTIFAPFPWFLWFLQFLQFLRYEISKTFEILVIGYCYIWDISYS